MTNNFPKNGQTVDSLKNEFAFLQRKTLLTGDPMMPDEVHGSKAIRNQMTERAEIAIEMKTLMKYLVYIMTLITTILNQI